MAGSIHPHSDALIAEAETRQAPKGALSSSTALIPIGPRVTLEHTPAADENLEHLRPGHNSRESPALDLLHEKDVSPERAYAVVLNSAHISYRAEAQGESSKLDVAIMIATLIRQSRKNKRAEVLKTLPAELAEQLDKSGNAIRPEHYTSNLSFARDDGANASARSRVKKAAEFLVDKHENDEASFIDFLMTITSMNQLRNQRLARPGRDDHQTKAAEKKQKAREKIVVDRESIGTLPFGEGDQPASQAKMPPRHQIAVALVRFGNEGLEVLGCVVGKTEKEKEAVKRRTKELVRIYSEQEGVSDKDLEAVTAEIDAMEAE